MFVFQISDYDDPALEAETAELLRQRLEAHSRRVLPVIWKMTDRFNAHAAKGPGREKRRKIYHIYGVFLIILGVFALVPGLIKPVTPALVGVGSLAVILGLLEFLMVRERKPVPVPASCRKEAQKLIEQLRSADWSQMTARVCFDENGMEITAGEKHDDQENQENQENHAGIAYDNMRGIFETDRLFLVLDERDSAILLQKKDLIAEEAEDFFAYISHKIQ